MDLRITTQALVSQTLASMQQSENQLANLQQQAATGNRINAPSDDPVAAVAVLSTNAQNLRLDAYLGNVKTAQDSLNTSTAALQQASSLLTQATSIATQGANAGNQPATLESLATQVDGLIGQMLTLANTKNAAGQYVFGGTATTTAPYSVTSTNAQDLPQTVSYVGGQQRAETPVSEQQTVATFYPGSEAFQSTGSSIGAPDVFQTLIALRDNLRNTQGLTSAEQQQAISGQLADLKSVQTGVLQVAGEQGSSLQTLSAVQSRIQSVQLNLQTVLSDLQGADVSQVVIGIQSQQNQLQLTLASASRLFSQSLLDFLK